MLIGLDAIPLTEPLAGVGHYTLELACALATAAPLDEFKLAYPSSFPPLDTVKKEELPSNLKTERVHVGALGRRWWSVGAPLYARRRGVSVFHGTNYDVPLWGSAVKVLTMHDLSLLLHPEMHEPRRVKRARRRLPLMSRAADAVITPTESVRREVCERLCVEPSRVFAVPEAARSVFRPADFASTEDTRRRLGAGDEFVLAVGTIEPRKNLMALVSVFEEITRARPQSRLRLVIAGGRGWLSGPLFDAVERSPARRRIVLTGYLVDEDLRGLYSSCRAFVYPSEYEGFGLPPLEAMSCGAPVVVGRASALAEVAGGAALLVEPHDHSEVARVVLELIEDEGARRRLSEAGRRRASEFSWPRTARMTLEVYAEAMKRSKRSEG